MNRLTQLFTRKWTGFLFVLFLFSMTFSSCETEKTTYRYTIENQSGVDVVLKSYLMKEDGSIFFIRYKTLAQGEKWENVNVEKGPGSSYEYRDMLSAGTNKINTLDIIYANQKKQQYQYQMYESVTNQLCKNDYGEIVPCDQRNLLNRFLYNSKEEYYTITKEDYEQAQDCAGDCD